MPYEYGDKIESSINNRNRNSGVYTRTILGQSIHENSVPVWTAGKENQPFVTFRDPKTGKQIGISKEALSYGLLTLADPGGGKTNLLSMILSGLLNVQGDREIIIIYDTKGDYLKEFGDRIPENEKIVIGTGEKYKELTSCWNIFGEIMPEGNDGRLVYTKDTDTDASDISKQIFEKMDSETQPIFPAMSRIIFSGGMLSFVRSCWRANPEKLNNKELRHFFFQNTNEELKEVFGRDYMKDYRSCMEYISHKGTQTQGVNSYLDAALRDIFVGPFAERNPEKAFSMQGVIKKAEKKVIFIEYDLKRGHVLEPVYGVLIDLALANALGGRETERNNVYFVLDEMLLLPCLTHLSNALNFGRSQGVKILCGLQNVSGLEDIYGEAGARRILASFQNIITFRTSDYNTRQFLMNRLGENYQNLSFAAQQENVQIQRAGHTVEDWDILSLKQGEAIISLRDESPFFFTMPKYQ